MSNYYPEGTECKWIFSCDYIPEWSVRTGVHNDPKPYCDKHKKATLDSLRDQGYYGVAIPIEEENGKHPERDVDSPYYKRLQKIKDDYNSLRYIIQSNSFRSASSKAAEMNLRLNQWDWMPLHSINDNVMVYEEKI